MGRRPPGAARRGVGIRRCDPVLGRRLRRSGGGRGDPGAAAALGPGGRRAGPGPAGPAGRVERYPARGRTLAPEGHSLVQAQAGLRDGESMADGVRRLEALLDTGYRDWCEREVWRRRSVIEGRSGALDLPGKTWRDRPAIGRGDGVFLAGDMVAGPGLLSEGSFSRALEASRPAGGYAPRRARPEAARPRLP